MIHRKVKKKYNVIYADPPWTYNNKEVKYHSGDVDIGAKSQYNLLSLEDLAALPVPNLCQPDAVCFMWCVVPMMPEAFWLLDKWGFSYRTMITWEKKNGSGYWFKGVTEHILFGIRGDVKAFRMPDKNIIYCKNSKHSRKPHHFRKLIEKATNKMDNPVRLEMFARSREGLFPDIEYKGWDVYGNQANSSINLKDYEKKDSSTSKR